MNSKNLMLMLIVVLCLISCIDQQSTKEKVIVRDWSSPESIDPFDENTGSFLDDDLRDYMINADQAYWNKDYKLAAQNYLYLLSHNVYDIISTYNLACTYALLEKPDLSAKFLFRAIDLGFVDFNYIQMIKNLGDEVVVEAKSLMKVRIAKPLAFYPDQKYTMVIGLHGHSSNHNQMVKIWRYFDIPEFIFAVPQAPYSVPIGQANEFRWNIDEVSSDVTVKSEKMSTQYVLEIMKNMKSRYNVGDIYLLGMHQGSSVAFDVALNNPQLVKGVIIFGTDFDIATIPDEVINKAKGLKFFMVNSPNDIYVDQERYQKIKKTLELKGFEVVYTEVDNEFSISRDALKASEKWFLGR
jgi:predicted esterase